MQSLSGTMWKLVEASASDAEGRELPPPLGPKPMGFVMFEEDRMMGAIVDGQSSSLPEGLVRPFAAYSGSYKFDGTTLVTIADSASSRDLLVEQIRHISFESPARMVARPVNTLLGHTGGMKIMWECVR
jgi:hypothetical protein